MGLYGLVRRSWLFFFVFVFVLFLWGFRDTLIAAGTCSPPHLHTHTLLSPRSPLAHTRAILTIQLIDMLSNIMVGLILFSVLVIGASLIAHAYRTACRVRWGLFACLRACYAGFPFNCVSW